MLVNHVAAPIDGVAHRAGSAVRSRCTLPTTARRRTRYFKFLEVPPSPISSIATPRYARFPTRGLNAGDALESRHDGRDVDGLRHQVGDLDTSGNASGITARIDGYLRHREFGWSAVAGRRSLPGQPDGASGVRSGDVDLDISSPDAHNRSVLIPVGSGTTGADSATPRGVRRCETQKTSPRVWRKPFKTRRLAGRP